MNTTFSTLGFTGRASLGWSAGPWTADAFVNYTNAYDYLRATSAFPNGQRIEAFTTIDTHIAYQFEGDGWLSQT